MHMYELGFGELCIASWGYVCALLLPLKYQLVSEPNTLFSFWFSLIYK